MKMIIEFMYQRVKSLILRCMTPIQLINMTTLLVLAQTNEYNNQQNIIDIYNGKVVIKEQSSEMKYVSYIFKASKYLHMSSTIIQALV